MTSDEGNPGEAAPPARGRMGRVVGVTIVIAAALFGIWIGLPIEGGLRQWVFEQTRPIRFREDTQRGFMWGRRAVDEGYLSLYDTMAKQRAADELWLDYAPLRLGVMRVWAGINETRFPGVKKYENTFAFARPVLWFNTAIELAGCLGILLLVRHWVIRRAITPAVEDLGATRNWRWRFVRRPVVQTVRASHWTDGVIPGVIAAMLMWFNPASLISAYGWPTWDVWVVPFFIWAVYLACTDRWLAAGAVMAAGALFKGQLLIVAGLFVVWPMCAGAPGRLLLLAGAMIVLMAVRAMTAGWISTAAHAAGLAVVAAMAVLVCLGADWRALLRFACGFVAVLGVIVSPWMLRDAATGGVRSLAVAFVIVAIAGTAALLVLGVRRKRLSRPMAITLGLGSIGVILLACMPVLGASSAWLACGWLYGTEHFDRLIVGLPNNLPALLNKRFGFDNTRDVRYVVFTLPDHAFWGLPLRGAAVTLKELLKAIFVMTMVPCFIAAAWHARRNDPRFLVAITTPWLLFFCLPLQIHERYLLFAAGAATCLVAVSAGMTLMGLLLSVLSCAMTLTVLLNPSRRTYYAYENPTSVFVTHGDAMRENLYRLHPDTAWLLLLAAAMFLYMAITPSRSRERTARTGC